MYRLVVLLAVVLLNSCGKDDARMSAIPNQITSSEKVIKGIEYYQARASEYALVDIETLAAMAQVITDANSTISHEDMRELLFADLRQLKQDMDSGIAPRAEKIVPDCMWERWLLLEYPLYITKTYQASKDALNESIKQWPGNLSVEDNKPDAFRHAYWNALLAKRINIWWAKVYTDAHESCTPANKQLAKAMDLHNNDVGRQIYSIQRHLSESQLMDRIKRYSYRFATTTSQMNVPSLVYIK